jgi:leucyl aminopeptidase
VTILEAFRTLLTNTTLFASGAEHTIEFQWYAAEEAGLLGSIDIFNTYAAGNREVVAMLNQDMTGYTTGYTSQNMKPKFGVMTDFTDASLTSFVKRVIKAYTKTDSADTESGYACSDHASATRAGYPSAYVFESEYEYQNPYYHTEYDTLAHVNYTHMVKHAKLVIGFVMELAFVEL